MILWDNITGSGRCALDSGRLLAEIQRADTAHARINTIQFLHPDPLAALGGASTLERIAKSTGGVFRFLSGREPNLEQRTLAALFMLDRRRRPLTRRIAGCFSAVGP